MPALLLVTSDRETNLLQWYFGVFHKKLPLKKFGYTNTKKNVLSTTTKQKSEIFFCILRKKMWIIICWKKLVKMPCSHLQIFMNKGHDALDAYKTIHANLITPWTNPGLERKAKASQCFMPLSNHSMPME